jgi:hypothetical protein
MSLELSRLFHLENSTVLDPALLSIQTQDEFDALLKTRCSQALWLTADERQGLQEGIRKVIDYWWKSIGEDPVLSEILFGSPDLESLLSTYVGRSHHRFLVTLHTLGSILDACRDDEDLDTPDRQYGWEELFNHVEKTVDAERAKVELARLPRNVKSWQDALDDMASTLANINVEHLSVAPVHQQSQVAYTSVTDELTSLENEQGAMSDARNALFMLSRLALVANVFLTVSLVSPDEPWFDDLASVTQHNRLPIICRAFERYLTAQRH